MVFGVGCCFRHLGGKSRGGFITQCFGQVVKKLLRGMDQEGNNNTFALFERRGNEDKAIEANAVVADVIAKLERYVYRHMVGSYLGNSTFKICALPHRRILPIPPDLVSNASPITTLIQIKMST